MASCPVEFVEICGTYLLKILANEPSIRYSVHFYDGTAELEARLIEVTGLDDEEYAPWVVTDVAAWQLEQMGYVELKELPEEMIDGTNDYQITLTEAGRELIVSGNTPEYRTAYN